MADTGESTVRIFMRHYFSVHLLWTAQHLSDLAGAMEDGQSGPSRFDIEHHSYVLSSVIASAAFLEAAINELFQDAHESHASRAGFLAPLDDRAIDAMAAVWRATDEGSKLRPLDKWQLLLVLAGRTPLDPGAAPYQDAQLVVQLRNAVSHYQPEQVPLDAPHRFEARLRGKFADNRLTAGMSGTAWWPLKCLGHGCAEWATESVIALADRVCADTNLRLGYRTYGDLDGSGRVLRLPRSTPNA